jgi:hypothetical protein
MFNPLLTDLSNLKDNELDTKIHELTKKYWISARSGNGALGQQILVILESYKDEMRKRQSAQQRSFAEKQNTDLDDLIR